MKAIILQEGYRSGKLTVISYSGINKQGERTYNYLCDCGHIGKARAGILKRKKISMCTKCGALGNLKHGESLNGKKTKEFRAYSHMKERCLNKDHKEYKNYGGRGIKVCSRWIESYVNFINDVGRSPSSKHSLDRENNEGNYEPSNVRWTTSKTQNRNKRTNFWIEFNGKKMILTDWANYFGVTAPTILYHFKKQRTIADLMIKYKSDVLTSQS